MKPWLAWSIGLALFLTGTASAEWKDKGQGGRDNAGRIEPSAQPRETAPRQQAPRPRVVINIQKPASGAFNRHYPTDQPANKRPSYGQMSWGNQAARPQRGMKELNPRQYVPLTQRPKLGAYQGQGVQAANVAHHHPYTPGYVRKKLRNIGVTEAPSFITDRSEILHTDRGHSQIRFPQVDGSGRRLAGTAVSPRRFNDPVVRNQMALAARPDRDGGWDNLERDESVRGRYFWHQDEGLRYCHFVDNSGYHWYGFYQGDQYFWARRFSDRWWWYDTDYDRWCFWNNGFWWWQDPYHVGDLYCYSGDAYIPCNSAEDQVVVSGSADAGAQAFNSPDGSRTVKVSGDARDAYLYDTANPPSFEPIYMASGVDDVQFSNANGRPLQIVLKLKDGSFDMFDAQGNDFNPGHFDAEQAQDFDDDQAQPDPQDQPAGPPDDGQPIADPVPPSQQ